MDSTVLSPPPLAALEAQAGPDLSSGLYGDYNSPRAGSVNISTVLVYLAIRTACSNYDGISILPCLEFLLVRMR